MNIFLNSINGLGVIIDTANSLCEVESAHLYISEECPSSKG